MDIVLLEDRMQYPSLGTVLDAHGLEWCEVQVTR